MASESVDESAAAPDQVSVLSLLASCKSRCVFLPLDLRLSLFSAAVHSYRCESLVKPFPSRFVDSDDGKQFDAIHRALSEIPTLFKLKETSQLDDYSWYLLRWVLTNNSPKIVLRSNQSEEIRQILAEQATRNYKPDYIFEVIPETNQRFAAAKQLHGSVWAFHGSKLENFHSILHNGLINCLNKRNLYGSGTYLSTQLSVAIEFSPFGFSWSRSVLGKQLSCVALCEVVKHPDIRPERTGSPSAYYLIQNDDFVRIAYLLVYSRHCNSNESRLGFRSSIIGQKYLFWSFIFVIVAILMAISFSKTHWLKMFLKFRLFVYKFLLMLRLQ